jgi:hypothetical protein
VGAIVTCMQSVALVALRKDLSLSSSLTDEIRWQLTQAEIARNAGVSPAPNLRVFKPDLFRRALVSCNPTLFNDIIGGIETNPGGFRGCKIAIIGPNGSGRKSIAEFIVSKFHRIPIITPFKNSGLTVVPEVVHEDDFYRGELDKRPLILSDEGRFLADLLTTQPQNSTSLLQRAAGCKEIFTIFITDFPTDRDVTQADFLRAIQGSFDFVLTTGELTSEQLRLALRDIFEIGDVSDNDLRSFIGVMIGEIFIVRRQLEILGESFSKERVFSLLRNAQNLTRNAGGSGRVIGFDTQ